MELQKMMQELARVEPDWFRLRNTLPNDVVPSESELVIVHNSYYRVVITKFGDLGDDDALLGTCMRAANARGWETWHQQSVLHGKIINFFGIDERPISDKWIGSVLLAESRHEKLVIAAATALLLAHEVEV